MPIPIFVYIHAASYLVPTIAGLKRFPKSSRAIRILAVLCVLACINVGAQLFLAMRKEKNYFISDYYRVVETSLLCAVFYFSVVSQKLRNLLVGMGIVFALIWAVDVLWFNTHDQMSNGIAMISRITVLLMSFIALQAAMKDEFLPLAERSIFWVGIGAAIYSSGTLLLLGLSHYLLQLGPDYFIAAWHINWALLIVANLFYTKGMLCRSRG